MHKILIYLYIIQLLKSSTCFDHYATHLQEVFVVIVYNAYIYLGHRPPEDKQGNARNM
jgi:hypothetical protein